MRRVPCELLGLRVDLPDRPQRIVSLVSGATEALVAMGAGARVVGVSSYCGRYVDVSRLEVVGDYLRVDEARLRVLEPDLVLLTSGVQLGVARRLQKAGFPVMVLPMPTTFAGILDNVRQVGALADETRAAEALADRMADEAAQLRARARAQTMRPRLFVDLWFGRHERTTGGLSFVHDLVQLAGAENIFGARGDGYCEVDLSEVRAARPEAILIFTEEDDHPVDVPALVRERGWEQLPVIVSDIARGHIVIHDGPSILDSARWLTRELESRQLLAKRQDQSDEAKGRESALAVPAFRGTLRKPLSL